MRFDHFCVGAFALAIAPVIASASSFSAMLHGPALVNNKSSESAVTGQANGSHGLVPATATVINFDSLAEGEVLAEQYAGLGVHFSADPANLAGTNMQATDVATGNVGVTGTPNLVSGKLIHTFDGWLTEADHPNVLATFDSPVGSVSIDFAGNSTTASLVSEIDFYDSSSTLIDFAIADPTGQANPYQQTVSYTSASNNIAFAVIWPGEFNDWVGWDNFTFDSVVPEPASMSALMLSSGLMFARRGRRR